MAATAELQQPVQSTSARRGPTPRTVIPVSDDWEDDEDEDEPQNAEDNQRIWDNANAQAPMPNLVVSGSNHAAAAPPAAAFQPKMRILKRPTNSAAVAAAPPTTGGETLKEREARYQAARDRIFGSEPDGRASPGEKKSGSGSGLPVVGVARNPRGPTSDGAQNSSGDTPPKGFGARSANPPPSPNPVREADVNGNVAAPRQRAVSS
ncbi:hypothetical protein C8F04DRAFT_1258544 [Mycena alexandri]|uniref:SUZ domain-containing protein n=1 Tax=Mycena alexandri TaxID=1745969 RepID=A0AAD6SY00_9AGAR|nr:hypothetical protein C8F04DRAFT_1258544 [Mycena alexandri]